MIFKIFALLFIEKAISLHALIFSANNYNTMKYTQFLFICLFSFLLLFTSCNKGEGLGGSSSLEGYIYNVVHRDDNFSFTKDTIPAVKEDVFIIFGTDDYFGDDIETDKDGRYRFDYLRSGTYVVYAYSSFADSHKEAVYQEVKVGGGLNKAPDIYIQTGKAHGTSMIKGSVYARYFDKGKKVDEGAGVGVRVYIKHHGEETHFDDVRAGDKGVFVFQKLLPGKYEIYTVTEDPDTEKLDAVIQTIEITETGKIYELPEEFSIIITV